jgi:hypothetical protein
MMVIHVDDCYTVGHGDAKREVIQLIEKETLELKVQENVTDYLGCEIVINKSRTKAWIGQPHMVNKIEKSFGELVKNMKKCKTPGTPSFNIIRPTTEEAKVSEEDQTIYRSCVGNLLYLIKYSRPDIANTVRELAKCMDGATPAAFNEMMRVIRFVLDTRDFGLKVEPKLQQDMWDMTIYTDSDWAGDKENRHSVTGYIMYLVGVPILWKSKLQRTVALSSTEAEYYAMSEATKEIKFILQILISIGITVQLPMIVRVDNVGAIFMSENATATSRTRHVDARYHFVREFIVDGYIKIVFVCSEDNHSDGFTKNVNNQTYERHVEHFIADRKEYVVH